MYVPGAELKHKIIEHTSWRRLQKKVNLLDDKFEW